MIATCSIQYYETPLLSCVPLHGHAFRPKNLRPVAYDELALGTALSGHFHPGNLEFTHIKRLTPASNFYPGQALHLGSLDPMAGPCPE